MLLATKFLGDASKNCTAWVRGELQPEDEGKLIEFLDLEKIAVAATGRKATTLQLASALWTLQEKMGLVIWTSEDAHPCHHMLLLMESRNFIRFDRTVQLNDWDGKLYMEAFKVDERKRFWFQLDFDKSFAEKHK